jgi:hypothetical protein
MRGFPMYQPPSLTARYLTLKTLGRDEFKCISAGRRRELREQRRGIIGLCIMCLWGPSTLKGQVIPPITLAERRTRGTEAVQSVLPY